MARKSQMEKIENVLRKYNTGLGISASKIASLARVPRKNVGKRVHDLREDYTIYTNYHDVKGKRTAFYRFEG